MFLCVGSKRRDPKQERWAYLTHSSSRSEHRIRLMLPTRASSDVVNMVISIVLIVAIVII